MCSVHYLRHCDWIACITLCVPIVFLYNNYALEVVTVVQLVGVTVGVTMLNASESSSTAIKWHLTDL